MELRHLRYFVAVAEESSLRRAAHRLHVSQPALSQQISDLEDELGLKLFARKSRGVELTEVGRVFLIGGRRVLVAAKQAAEQAQEAAKGERGRLVIGSLGAATISFLSGVLSRFRDQRPQVEITLLHMNNRAQVEAVLDGSIMLGIGYYSYALEEDEQEQVSTGQPAGVPQARRRGLTQTTPGRRYRFVLPTPGRSRGADRRGSRSGERADSGRQGEALRNV